MVSGTVGSVRRFQLTFSHQEAAFFETAFASCRGSLATSYHPLPESKVIRSGLAFPNRGLRCWSNSSRLISVTLMDLNRKL